MILYELLEIDIDEHGETHLLTARELITTAQEHCSAYDDGRQETFLPIDTLVKAIRYFANNGFVVVAVPQCLQITNGAYTYYKMPKGVK